MLIVLVIAFYYKKEFIYKIGSVTYIYKMVFEAKGKDQDKIALCLSIKVRCKPFHFV